MSPLSGGAGFHFSGPRQTGRAGRAAAVCPSRPAAAAAAGTRSEAVPLADRRPEPPTAPQHQAQSIADADTSDRNTIPTMVRRRVSAGVKYTYDDDEDDDDVTVERVVKKKRGRPPVSSHSNATPGKATLVTNVHFAMYSFRARRTSLREARSRLPRSPLPRESTQKPPGPATGPTSASPIPTTAAPNTKRKRRSPRSPSPTTTNPTSPSTTRGPTRRSSSSAAPSRGRNSRPCPRWSSRASRP